MFAHIYAHRAISPGLDTCIIHIYRKSGNFHSRLIFCNFHGWFFVLEPNVKSIFKFLILVFFLDGNEDYMTMKIS